ncbi:helix-turn-helix transcriptional regulator [Paracoccus rhizosphaerae]|uniref:AraC family transcriptional regulator n=1 Tax=Paracoccus rhizosphaerae TaxID=1133347 RepID=A0ABV6CF57_9RHOB|nr:AraC family transcriptional regulator [Paracoccus rhizosphaerae]
MRHSHDQFGIGVILRGAQTSSSGRGTVEAQAGDLIAVNPGEVHDGAPLGEGGRAWQMLYFEPIVITDAMEILAEGAVPAMELSHPALRDPCAADQFRRLFSAVTDVHGSESEIADHEALVLLLAHLTDRPRPKEVHVPAAIADARARIDEDPAAPLTLAELADLGGVSRFHLLRGFARITGLTPHAYLVQRRLHLARRMIAAGDALADVAQAAGFSDQSHMTRLFIRSYGISPGRYAAAQR